MKKSLLIAVALFVAASVSQAQVTQINSNNSLQVSVPLNGIKTIIVSEADSSVWVSEGTQASTFQLSPDIRHVQGGGIIAGKYIFSGKTTSTGTELYITDGTAAGTTLLLDIYTGTMGSEPADFALMNGGLYFSAATAAEGRELWKTDGTPGGTTLLKDIVPGTGSSNRINQYDLFTNGTYLLFAANTVAEGLELWTSNGTSAGTVLLKNIYGGADSSSPRNFYALNNIVLFLARDAANGEELWKTDGTASGTLLVKDINAGPGSSASLELFPGFSIPLFSAFHTFNNRAYFTATDGSSTGQMWGTDGITANTTLVKDIVPGASLSYILLVDAVNLPAKFIFPVSDGISRSELWESDGTPGGTVLFKSFSPITPGDLPLISLPYSFDGVSGTVSQALFQGNKFFFLAGTATEGTELWISDGTLANTSMIKDINPGPGNGLNINENISYLYTSSFFFFAANDGVNGNELWRSDGTGAGTVMVQDINLNAGSASPELSIVNNGKVFFSATDGNDPLRTDLFVVDGVFAPLPVTLSRFWVIAESQDALLQWTTAAEINVSRFTVQRSYDGVQFENIGVVTAAGNSNSRRTYVFTDQDIATRGKTLLYYRLLTTDTDGKAAYSSIVMLRLKALEWSVQLMGNPVKDHINVALKGATGVQVSVKDVSGRVFFNRRIQVTNEVLSLPAYQLPPGMYILVITNGDEKKSIRFLK
jgi:ELWxxDGT repeat protein